VVLGGELFSPNSDGHDDLLLVHYQLKHPGFVARVAVHDEEGRMIAQLADNLLLGAEGLITWDGVNADGRLSPIGRYLVSVLIFDTAGHVQRFRLPAVLAGPW
jgi:hypothetical protein